MIRSAHQNSSLILEAIVIVGQSQKSEIIFELIGLVTELLTTEESSAVGIVLMSLQPIITNTDIHFQRDAKLRADSFHLLTHHGYQPFLLLHRAREVEFVVHL